MNCEINELRRGDVVARAAARLLVLEVEVLFWSGDPAALPAASACALCVSWARRPTATRSCCSTTLRDVPLCNALTRSPALASNCCKLIDRCVDICENRVFGRLRLLLPEARSLAEKTAELALADAAVAVRIDGGEQLSSVCEDSRRCLWCCRWRSSRWCEQ